MLAVDLVASGGGGAGDTVRGCPGVGLEAHSLLLEHPGQVVVEDAVLVRVAFVSFESNCWSCVSWGGAHPVRSTSSILVPKSLSWRLCSCFLPLPFRLLVFFEVVGNCFKEFCKKGP